LESKGHDTSLLPFAARAIPSIISKGEEHHIQPIGNREWHSFLLCETDSDWSESF
jgi:hypothetical protein